MLEPRDHHIKDEVCLTRAHYREGRKARAVKVYTVAQESKYLLVQNIPSVGGVFEQLMPLFYAYGDIENYWPLDEYIPKQKTTLMADNDNQQQEFNDCLLVKFKDIYKARIAKIRLDDYNFMGNNLHICYAPDCETYDDLKEKLNERRMIVARKCRQYERKRTHSNNNDQSPFFSANKRLKIDDKHRQRGLKTTVPNANYFLGTVIPYVSRVSSGHENNVLIGPMQPVSFPETKFSSFNRRRNRLSTPHIQVQYTPVSQNLSVTKKLKYNNIEQTRKNLNQLSENVKQHHRIVQRQAMVLGPTQGPTLPSSSSSASLESFDNTIKEIREKMRDAVKKSNLIPLVLLQKQQNKNKKLNLS
ncbi:unnamed protein product [Didymodactylos carnosus]|uniref:RNA-binding protein 48 n=1 Tax=Didymodactylos carnosus TaxID=1234261 RepID=A0A813VEZ8_9BILA|nr:unnamed protein product [Didymodactylos carnosus]CAF1343753.1 unnamed protein product [Didymodactylos carnosus]CAF3623731.1 unnamed protein product [Didymodactylos carnosus]CAF4154793.1 unnamed protein product [Didymodactylos carnosus]